MATYDSIHTGEQVDQAVDIVLGNKSKGSATQPIYLDANGVAQNVNVDATPTDSSANLVRSGGVFTQLSTKYAKADISTDVNLGTSNTVIPSQGAVKSYVDTKLATKQDVVVAGDGIVKTGNTLSISTDNDFMTAGKLNNKWSHFVSGLDMGYGTETIEKMEAAKRSTFDRSKFNVIGSPNITSDGIASGFSSSNYLTTPIIDFSKPFEIIFEENFINRPSGLYSRLLNIQGMMSSDKIGYYIQVKLGSDSFSGIFNVIVNNTIHWEFTKFIWTGEQYQVYTRENETAEWILRNTYDSTACPSNANNETTATIVMGYHQNSGYSADGSIDLKQFSITVDGVEVFSGNKTGIDTIKPDDYTVVGTPTISADGVAKYIGTASGRITTTTIDFSTSSSWEIVFPYYTGNTNTGIQVIMGSETGSVLQLVRFQNTNTCQMQCPATSFGVSSSLSDFSLNLNTQYICKVGQFITNGVITTYFKYKADTDNNYTVLSNTNATNIFDYTGAIAIGGYNGTNMMAYGSIDLNAFKIYVDGNLVYQPCLKIPYTQTKDGKKIVDYNYKSRVEDEYGQAGFTPYYTLDTESRGNYKVVGSPTINSDFIASGFSTSNNINIGTIPTPTSSLDVTFKVALPNSTITHDNGVFAVAVSGNGISFMLKLYNNNTFYQLALGSTTATDITGGYKNVGAIDYGQDVLFKLTWDGSIYKFKKSLDNGETFTQLGSWESTSSIGTNQYKIGYNCGELRSIDLKELKVYVDNKLAYQAVIPPNYTMATVKESAIVDSYDNGINKWTKLANLTCKQQGSCTSGTAVTFTKPYIDTNYALSVPYSAKTKTGFTPSATGDWIANGKVNLNA